MADPDLTQARHAIQHAIRIAIQHPDRYLAALVAEQTDDVLAAKLGAPCHRVWALRLAQPPRPTLWENDILMLAAAIHGDPAQLDAYLRGLGLGPEV